MPGVRTRESELGRFRSESDCLVLLANPAALGEGVSLHETCNDAIYLERTFNAGQYLQSLDRIHRLGLPPGAASAGTIADAANASSRLDAWPAGGMTGRELMRILKQRGCQVVR